MKTQTANDGIGSRRIRHKNFLAVTGQGIVEFTGQSIAPVLRVTKTTAEGGGKWHKHIWECEVADNAELFSFTQDWEMGTWFVSKTWAGALDEFRKAIPADIRDTLTDEHIVRCIRAALPKSAATLDAAEQEWQQAGDQLAELLAAQAELAEAKAELQSLQQHVQQLDAAEQARQEAAETRARVDRAKQAMRQGASLADLKDLLGATQ